MFKRELRSMLKLAIPLILAELGWMMMGVVDTVMVGRLPNSAETIGAVSLGSILFYTIGICGSGLLLGLDTLISQSFGAGDLEDCRHSLVNSVYICIPLAPLLMAIVWMWPSVLQDFGIHPNIMRQMVPYLHALIWSAPPLLLYFAFRRYLQGMNLVAPVTFALITANVVNLLGNYALIYGHWGAPAMGTAGSGWATCASRVYMAAVLIVYAVWHDRSLRANLLNTPRKPDLVRIATLLRLGAPAALQILFETGVFAAATALIGKLSPVALAGHQIALNAASVTFIVTLAIGSAAAVRVGQATGAGDARAAARAGWTAIGLAAAFMSGAAIMFWTIPKWIARIYTDEPAVIAAGVSLLAIAAVFQLFDGLQAVATGALRGLGDTRTPMLANLIAYWVIGLPAGSYLCFALGWGAEGLWWGLCAGLILIGIALPYTWHRRSMKSVSDTSATFL